MLNKSASNRNDTLGTALGRRRFLQTAAAGAALPYLIPRHVLAAAGSRGANDRVAIGVIGTGSRVSNVLAHDSPPGEMRLVALADCNLPRIPTFIKAVKATQPEAEKCRQYQDYRQLLDKESWTACISPPRRTPACGSASTPSRPASTCMPRSRSR